MTKCIDDDFRRRSVSFDAYYFENQKKEGAIFSMKETFTHIAEINLWGSDETLSGVGSADNDTQQLTHKISALLKKLKIKSIIDAPCGDFNWLSSLSFEGIQYCGLDILNDMIDALNQQYYNHPSIQFKHSDITKGPLPKADLILCRDCLVHFSNDDIKKTIQNFKQSGARYLLTTAFPKTKSNKEIVTGDWQPLNLQAEPFCFPKPLELITEDCQQNDGLYQDKSLGLWGL